MVIMLIRGVLPSLLSGTSRPRTESTACVFPHSPLLLLLPNELFHRIIILGIDMDLLVNKLFISLLLYLGEALLAETVGTHEDPHILEVILLLLYVVLALHNGKVEDLALISLVTMEGRDARTYLFDLHAVG